MLRVLQYHAEKLQYHAESTDDTEAATGVF